MPEPVLVVKDGRFSMHLEGLPHLESPRRVKAFAEILSDQSLQGRWEEVLPREAALEEISWVHTPEYIAYVGRSAGRRLTSFDLDTQATEKTFEVARLGVGGVFSLLDHIWQGPRKRGFACIRPPGHHAEPDKAMGFCIFNNVALGARYLKERYSARRVMIIDIDLHHGNGIQKAFYETDEVLYLSMHHFPAYPGTGNLGEIGAGRGEGFTVNVPLARGQGDKEFAQIIYYLVNPIAQDYRPEIILVSCGFDLYQHDRLGSMMVTPEGYALMTYFLLAIADKVCDGRIAFVMEGGYSLKGIRECGLRVMQELCGVPTLSAKKLDTVVGGGSGKRPSILRKVVEVHQRYWKSLG